MANTEPDSRTPRRLMPISTRMMRAATQPSLPFRKGSIALAFWTPEDTETATVST